MWIVILILLIVVLFFGTLVFVQWLAQRRSDNLLEDYPVHELVIRANSFGLESDGMRQVRGNGTFLVTSREVVFEQWLPQKRIIIPIKSINDLTTPQSFLGKSNGNHLLRLDFTNTAGESDAVAWHVPNLNNVIRVIESLR